MASSGRSPSACRQASAAAAYSPSSSRTRASAVNMSGRPGAALRALKRIARALPRSSCCRCRRARSSCRSMVSGANARPLSTTAMASSTRPALASWLASSWKAGVNGGRRAVVRRNCSIASARRPALPSAAPSQAGFRCHARIAAAACCLFEGRDCLPSTVLSLQGLSQDRHGGGVGPARSQDFSGELLGLGELPHPSASAARSSNWARG